MTALTLHPLGEAALCLRPTGAVTLARQEALWQLADGLARVEGVLECIPGMNNLTLVFDPLRTEAPVLEEAARLLWSRPPRQAAAGRVVEIPVRYGSDAGPDLDEVAEHCGMTPDEVVRRHTGGNYVVYFVGFQPGFAYLGGLDPALHMPRRAAPRVAVPAGSVGIGGAQTGVYPLATPGGWQLIGRTARVLFDPRAEPPTLLAPGDRVRFVAEPA
jgi:KipI family sensor histidine kinase inhibitor